MVAQDKNALVEVGGTNLRRKRLRMISVLKVPRKIRNNTVAVWSPCARITLGFDTFPIGQCQTFCAFTSELGREILYVGASVGAHKRSPTAVPHLISMGGITLVMAGPSLR